MESPKSFRCLSRGYSKIPSSNFSSSQQEKNILWRVMRVVTVKLKKSKSTASNIKSRISLDQESHLIINDSLINNLIDTNDHQLITETKNDPINPILMNLENQTTTTTTRLRIYVKIASKSQKIVVEANNYHIINDIKSKIRAFEGIESRQYSLFYNGKRVEDYRTLASLGIRTESTLHLIFEPKTLLKFKVKTPSGKILELEADLMYTVRDLKAIVESFIGCPVSDCRVILGRNEIFDEGKSLAFYGAEEGSFFELLSSWVQIFVKTWSGKTVTLFVRKTSTFGEVKEKLFCKIGVPIARQRIVFSGKRLRDDNRTLSSFGVCKESTLYMV